MKHLGVVIGAIVTACALVTPAFGQAGPAQLAFAPVAQSVVLGATANVDVAVANVPATPGLGGYDIVLKFDASIAQLTALTDAGLLTKGSNIVICTPAQIDNSAGSATINCTPVPLFTSPGFSTTAPVPLLHASFMAKTAGMTSLDLTGSTLQDPGGTNIASALATGSITVQPAAAAPSPMPSPATAAATKAAPSATQTPVSTTASTVTAAATVAVVPSATLTAAAVAVVQPPATGDGGGSAMSHWWIAAIAALAVLGVGASGIALARRRR